MSEETFVRKFAFRPYEGEKHNRIYRIWSIAIFNFKYQWDRSIGIKILIGFIVFIFFSLNSFLFIILPLFPAMDPNEILETQLWSITRGIVGSSISLSIPGDDSTSMESGGNSYLFMLAVILMGAGLIADDVRYKATEVYFAKIDRLDYIIGKYGAFFIFGNLIFTAPYIFEWIMLIIGIHGVDLLKAIPVLIQVIIFTEAVTLVYGSIILLFSALTSRRLYAGLGMFFFIFTLSLLVPTFVWSSDKFTPIMYFDILTVLTVFSSFLQGETTISYTVSNGAINDLNIPLDLTGSAGLYLFPFLLFYMLIGLAFVYYQLVWRQSKQ